ncbi:hypothetical protein MAPG_10857 [Magnaporthiopsis poae ATCC 64411]|uniref:GET complex subunit GET2 n=1 Tax=Magnaporthiopsis poae (strain ATCC 64411 / 73-15) TaxID=644358 RepID=A0A0C4EDQ1_MAGP6|nr:hypothetical protein MAPG_10857 [Magnaporthiopsis poae ATCC 64411]
MTEGVGTGATSAEDAAAARAAEQARIRKERREAKIKAGGSARLNKITGLGGGLQRDPIPQPPTAEQQQPSRPAATSAAAAADEHADPAEVDISEHHYVPRATPRRPADSSSPAPGPELSEAQLRQFMLGLDPQAGAGAGAGAGVGANDPMVQLLNQMLTTMGGGAVEVPSSESLHLDDTVPRTLSEHSPYLTHCTASSTIWISCCPATPPVDTYARFWRLLHLVLSASLGLYLVVSTGTSNAGFTGSREDRDRAAVADADGIPDLLDGDVKARRQVFFMAFLTVEAVLITSRFFLDRARPQPTGLVWTVAGFLPDPYRAYTESVLRYSQIISTLRADLLVLVFMLGVSSLLRSCSFCGFGGGQ